MGQEISTTRFKKQDFSLFAKRLASETALLQQCFDNKGFSRSHAVGGFELEAWLVDRQGEPAPINEPYLARLGDSALYTPELSRFNIELNSTPQPLGGDALARMHRELERNWRRCFEVAGELDAALMMVGILPTLRDSMLSLENMSRMERYRALNEQVLRLREGRPLTLNIVGEQHLEAQHSDVMLEAATTSLQIHLQVSQERAVRYYNAMQILSAPMVAISANSPLLFGKRLWQETRIPLFEQAVASGGIAGGAFGPLKRVSFGSGYARQSIMEVFAENAEHFPLLLPVNLDGEPGQFNHLRLHNGTIWRWNRPLVGFDDDGTPHLRIEHRVMPAGPSVIDTIANIAFFYGLAYALAQSEEPPEQRLEFFQVRDNLYAAARYGLNAQVTWLDGRRGRMGELLERLIPLAREGLDALGCDAEDRDGYLAIIEQRLLTGQTGAAWQLAWLERHGEALSDLVGAYLEHQQGGRPVHEWPV
ncbi:MAG: glutamate-cysteine ligase family protein [Pseudomonadota bacterium]